MKKLVFPAVMMVIVLGAVIWNMTTRNPPADPYLRIDPAALVPDWAAIAAWPPADAGAQDPAVAAMPDPTQVTTLIILDDSTSMGSQLEAAKDAVVQAVAQFDPDSRVGVVALNAGVVLPVSSAGDAARRLPGVLVRIRPDGTTPLGARLAEAGEILTEEARQRRGFGTFRILVTTDGAASDGARMNTVVARILSTTPIELATIGLGIGEGHALNVPGFTSYVSVGSVGELAAALSAAAAEQTTFQPITRFEE